MEVVRKLYDLKNQRKTLLDEATTALEKKDKETYNAKMGEVKNLNEEIQTLEDLAAETGRFEKDDPQMVNRYQAQQEKKEETQQLNALDQARSGNEYANAFTAAINNGMTPKTIKDRAEYKPLMNALTIGGGTPAGADGGFLVPVEFDNMIHRKMKDFIQLSDFFNTESVSGMTGWRAVEKAKASKKLPVINEAAAITPDDQPSFEKVVYTVKKYGDIIPVSSELAEDNTAGLMQYLAEWFAPKVVLTENALLLALLDSITATALTAGSEVKGLKQALNKALNTAYSKAAILLCNQDSYSAMDELEDAQKRGLLVPDPTAADVYRFKGRRVVYADNDLLPSTETAAPIYIGDFKSFGTLFRRKALEFASTNIGGQSWRTDTTEVRGLVRMDAQKMDATAAIKRTVTIAS